MRLRQLRDCSPMATLCCKRQDITFPNFTRCYHYQYYCYQHCNQQHRPHYILDIERRQGWLMLMATFKKNVHGMTVFGTIFDRVNKKQHTSSLHQSHSPSLHSQQHNNNMYYYYIAQFACIVFVLQQAKDQHGTAAFSYKQCNMLSLKLI